VKRIPETRLRHLARQVHSLGERPLFELFRELEAGAELADALERYAEISPYAAFIAANGADRLAQARLIVGGLR
jgi:hypothetical protein